MPHPVVLSDSLSLFRGMIYLFFSPPSPPPRWTSPTAGAIPLSQRGVCDYPVYHTPIAIAITPLLEGNRLPPLLRRGIGVFSPSPFPLPSGERTKVRGPNTFYVQGLDLSSFYTILYFFSKFLRNFSKFPSLIACLIPSIRRIIKYTLW